MALVDESRKLGISVTMDETPQGVRAATTSALLLGCITLLLSLHLCRWLRQWSVPGVPGPFPWPVIGNASQLGKAPHLSLTRMAQKYGNVFQIKLGCRSVVVLNGDSIKSALIKQGKEFAGRPNFTSFQFVGNGNSLAFNTVTDWWKLHRRATQSTVRMFSTGNPQTKKTFEHHVLCEVKQLLQLFLLKTKEQGYFHPMTLLVVSTANIMSAVCFGKRYSYDDEEFRQVVGRNDQFTETVGAGSIVDVMPWLQYFPNPVKTMFDNFKSLNRDFSQFIGEKVFEHRKTIQSSVIRDITDSLILALDHLRDKTGVSEEKDIVTSTVGDIFGASQDTLSTAQQWIMLILVKYPELQTRLQQGVAKVVARSQLPSFSPQPQLPYVMAFIYEVFRFTSFIPLTIPHSTTADTTLMGYAIPKDTVIFINQWSTNHNPSIWHHPDVFDPERFLDQQGALNKDMTSSVLIFSQGKRRCVGEDLSKLQLFLFTALLSHQCHITANPAVPPKLDYNYGLTLKPHTFFIAVTPRGETSLLDREVSSPDHNEETTSDSQTKVDTETNEGRHF
ncbi:cytochrome P450 1B1 [Cynoglossus semilaevis]|uniref:Cytochrome P450, family 1, subfamily B, polypeptide 1 n=2 Tax=Cynoglossus semilaevis TaxID=244447 RepID=A0A3P8VLC8_CYNSE|nr:cytochrome P450 1B1-like [Cynoglossus semilaevis]